MKAQGYSEGSAWQAGVNPRSLPWAALPSVQSQCWLALWSPGPQGLHGWHTGDLESGFLLGVCNCPKRAAGLTSPNLPLLPTGFPLPLQWQLATNYLLIFLGVVFGVRKIVVKHTSIIFTILTTTFKCTFHQCYIYIVVQPISRNSSSCTTETNLLNNAPCPLLPPTTTPFYD